MRVVLDTNVLISAIHFGGPPREVLERAIRAIDELYLSPAMLEELSTVLQREKSGYPQQAIELLLTELTALAHVVRSKESVQQVTEDPDDDRILECAVGAQADYLISGDKHLLRMGRYRRAQIVSPTDYLRRVTQADDDEE